MNRYLKLVVMELQRFWKLYAALAALTVISQVGGMIFTLSDMKQRIDQTMAIERYETYAEYAAAAYQRYQPISFRTAVAEAEPWIYIPIFLCITALAGYCFFIWYRDWIGKSTFIYRLLMLPTTRMNLFWSKLTAILLFVLGLIALQLLLIVALIGLYRQMIPPELAIPETMRSFIHHDRLFRKLIPSTITGFLVTYGTGALGVIVLFTAIVIERCWRWIGIVLGAAYAAAACLAFLLPHLITMFESRIVLYPMEIFLLQFAAGLVLLGASLTLSKYLLTHKINV